ncbi:MFS general substrate transporter [Periconia macrospinosa]|uniref:MFS general substrate transporter n=1 Tax=Periconia macrospinosa TaxID=97972 RepID=A0A2V1D8G9_9PLEO|nr:MFS general substrate transporter [Periconia macrospinosa]
MTWLTQHGNKPPWLLKYRSSEGFIVATVSLAVFTDMFLYGVIVPVIPFAIERRSHVNESRVQYWVSVLIAVYAAALLFFSPICGFLADRLTTSRRTPLLLGLFALLGATVLLNVGSSIGILVVGRMLQGTSAAVVWSVGLALLADTIPQERLAQGMGYVGIGMSVGILIAPLLGGVVYDRAGYNAVYGMSYALIGVDIVLRLLLVEKKVAARWSNEPAVEQAEDHDTAGESSKKSGEAAVSPIMNPTSAGDPEKAITDGSAEEQPQEAATHPTKKRLRDRLPPVLSLLYSRRLLAALFGCIIQAALMTSFDAVLTIHVANTFNWTSTAAALLFLPLVIPSFVAPLFGWLSDRFGGRYLVAIGFLFTCPPLVCLRFVNENTLRVKVLLCALLALIGLFLTMTYPALMAEISAVVEAKEKKMLARGEAAYGKGGAYAQAYALFNVAFAAGCMIGPLLAGFIVQKRGWPTMGWVLGLLTGITAVPSFLWMGGFIFEGKKIEDNL